MAITAAEILVRIGINDDLTRGLNQIGNKLVDFGSRASSIGAGLTLGLTAPLVGFAAAAITAAGDIDALKRSLAATMGNAGAAATQFERLKEVAKLPGLGLEDVVRGFVQLKESGINISLAERSIMAFGNALTTLGKSKAELSGLFLAMTQINTAPKIMAQDLKQLTDRLPMVKRAMMEMWGAISAEDLNKKGVSPQAFVQGLIHWLEQLPKAMGGIKTQLEIAKEEMTLAMAAVGDAMIPFVTQALDMAVPAIKAMSEWFAHLDPTIKNVVMGFGGLAIASGPALLYLGQFSLIVGTMIQVFGSAGGAIAVLKAALMGLGALAVTGAGVYAAWNIGQWAYNNIPGVAALANMLRSLPGVGSNVDAGVDWFQKKGDDLARKMGIQNTTVGSETQLLNSLKALEAQAQRLGIATGGLNAKYASGQLSLNQYWLQLNQLVRAKQGAIGVTTPLTKEIAQLEAALKAKGITMTQGNMASEQYVALLRSMTTGASGAAEATRLMTMQELIAKEAHDRGQAGLQNLIKLLTDATYSYGVYTEKIKLAVIEQDALTRANKEWEAARPPGKFPTPEQIEVNDSNLIRGTVFENFDGSAADLRARANALSDAYLRTIELQKEGKKTALDVKMAYDAWTKAEMEAAGMVQKRAKESKTAWEEMRSVVEGTFDRMISGFADAIISGRGFFDVLKSAWKDLAGGLLDTLMHSLLDPLKEGLSSVLFGGGKGGGGGLLGGVLSSAGSWLGSLFGGKGGAAGGAGSGLTGSLVSTGISAGLSALVPGGGEMMGMLGMGAGGGGGSPLLGAGGSLLSTALSFLGPEAKQEATLNQIERNTAAGSIHLQHILDQGNLYWPKLESINMFLWDILAPSFASLMTTVEGIHEFLKPDEFGIAGMQPVVVAALVADDANMEIFARRLNEILRNQGG